MKYAYIAIFSFLPFCVFAQKDTTLSQIVHPFNAYEKHALNLTFTIGFIDQFRSEIKLPADYENNKISGFAPLSLSGDYAISNRFSLGVSLGYDAFIDNFDQLYYGNGETFRRYYADNIRIFSGAVTGYYHFKKIIHSNNIDLFAGAGLQINNIRHSNAPQADSVAQIVMNHSVTPILKAGCSYFITEKVSLYGSVGYTKQSAISLGFTYRFRSGIKEKSITTPTGKP